MGRKATDLSTCPAVKVAGLPGRYSPPSQIAITRRADGPSNWLHLAWQKMQTIGGAVLLSLLDYLAEYLSCIWSKFHHLSNLRKWHTARGIRRTVFITHRLLLWICILILPCALSLVPWTAVAGTATVTIGWDPPPEPDIAGYKVYYGTSSGDYQYSVDVGNFTSCTTSGLAEGTTYYFAAKTYDIDDVESEFSEELAFTVPVTNPEDVKLWIEAEDGDLYNSFETAEDSTASAGKFVWTPGGTGDYHSPSDPAGYAEYVFDVPTAGDYIIWGNVLAASSGDNSFHVAVDGGAYALWDTVQSQSWVWDQVSNRDGADPIVYYLEAGQHSLVIMHREDGTKIDKILITNDPAYVPEGTGEPGEPVKVKLWLEAEKGELSYPFKSDPDSKASSGRFAWVPNGRGSSWDPEQNSGAIVFTFELPAAGDYVLWGCVKAKNGKDNSFYVAVNDGAYALWDTIQSKAWTWDPVSNRSGTGPVIYALKAGTHTLTIKQREDGTRIDRILITNDLEFVP